MNIDDVDKRIDEWFASPKADEYFAKEKREEERHEIWLSKANELQKTLNDEELETLIFKVIKREVEYIDMFYKRGVLTYSNIISLIFDVACEYGTNIENDEDFPTSSHEFRGFVVNISHGQGSALWITYKGERIL